MRTKPKTTLIGTLVALAVAAVVMAGCVAPGMSSDSSKSNSGGGGTSARGTGENYTVGIQGSSFSPAAVTLKVGDTITFVNRDKTTHQIAIGDSDVGADSPLQKLVWTAEKPGTFVMKCTDQPSKTGKVVVLPAQ